MSSGFLGLFAAVPVLMFGAFVALVIVLIIFGSRAAKARKEALVALAARLGLDFRPDIDRTHDNRYPQFGVFRTGSSRAAYNTLSGPIDLPTGRAFAVMGDYRYTTESGTGKDRRTTTHHFSYLLVHLPHPSTPDLDIRPENLFDKIAGVFSDKDIDFESEEFSRKFHVACPDRKFAYDLCHPRMMQFLLESKPPAIDIERGVICLTGGLGVWDAPRFENNLSWLNAFLSHWPEHLIKDLDARESRSRESHSVGGSR